MLLSIVYTFKKIGYAMKGGYLALQLKDQTLFFTFNVIMLHTCIS